MNAARAGDLMLTGNGQGPLEIQIADILHALQKEGLGPEALALLRDFYRPGPTA